MLVVRMRGLDRLRSVARETFFVRRGLIADVFCQFPHKKLCLAIWADSAPRSTKYTVLVMLVKGYIHLAVLALFRALSASSLVLVNVGFLERLSAVLALHILVHDFMLLFILFVIELFANVTKNRVFPTVGFVQIDFRLLDQLAAVLAENGVYLLRHQGFQRSRKKKTGTKMIGS